MSIPYPDNFVKFIRQINNCLTLIIFNTSTVDHNKNGLFWRSISWYALPWKHSAVQEIRWLSTRKYTDRNKGCYLLKKKLYISNVRYFNFTLILTKLTFKNYTVHSIFTLYFSYAEQNCKLSNSTKKFILQYQMEK